MTAWNCVRDGCRLFKGVSLEFTTWMSHGDEVIEVPHGFRITARSSNGTIAAICACPDHPPLPKLSPPPHRRIETASDKQP